MPKRSRYDYVTVVNGEIQIYASGVTYTFDVINNWKSYESTSKFNPEDVEYILNVFSPSGDHLIVCKDYSELQAIAEELKEQGI
jgi:hypothetical protein